MLRTIIAICLCFSITPALLRAEDKAPRPLTEEERSQLVSEIERHRNEANKHIEAGRLPEALQPLKQVLALRRKLWNTKEHERGHRELIISLADVGRTLQDIGRLAEALPYMEETVAMARRLYPEKEFPQGHRDLAGSLNSLAQLYEALGQYEKALPHAEACVAGFRLLFPPKDFPDGHPDLALVICNCAGVLELLGRLEDARRLYEDAVTMCRRLDARHQFPTTQRVLGMSLGNLANTLGGMGLNEQALACYEESLALCRRVYAAKTHPRGHSDLANALNNLGLALAAVGNPERALPYFEETLAMCRRLYPEREFPNGHPQLALALHNLGHGLGELKQRERALDYLQQGLAMRRRLFSKKDFPRGHPDLAASIFSIVGVLRALDRSKDAIPLCEEVLAMCRKLYPRDEYPGGHPDIVIALDRLGQALTFSGRAPDAIPLYEEALSLYRRQYPMEHYPVGHHALAFQLHSLGIAKAALREPKEALPHLEESLVMYNRLIGQQALFAPEADALELTAAVAMARDDYLSIALEIASPDKSVYGHVWDSKAALTRILERRLLATRMTLAKGEAPLRTKWEELTSLRRRIGQLQQSADFDPTQRDALLAGWFDQADRLERELIRLLPALGRERDARRRTADDLISALPPRSAFVDFLRYERSAQEQQGKGKPKYRTHLVYVAFVAIPGKGVKRVELPDAKAIDEGVKKWRESITQRSAETAHSQKLRELVWEPVAKHLPADTETVWLAPDGDLARLPFAALPGTNRGTVLLEEMALCVVPHGPFLLDQLLSRSTEPGAADRKLILGGVRYDAVIAASGKGRWPFLQGTATEAEQLRKLAESSGTVVTLSDGEATSPRLAGELPKARYAHLATHGFFDEEGLVAEERRKREYFELLRDYEYREGQTTTRGWGVGKRSPLGYVGLVLANANEPLAASRPHAAMVGGCAIVQAPNPIFSGDRIAELPLQNLKLCVLSACETGLGNLTGGEGVQGLQRAFHLAGCQNVVCSLWSVNDEATAALMRRFYYHLWEKKLEPLAALRQAQLELYRNPGQVSDLLRGNAPKFSGATKPLPKEVAPKEGERAATKLWAAFVLSGVGK